jgi:hypothetical protein
MNRGRSYCDNGDSYDLADQADQSSYSSDDEPSYRPDDRDNMTAMSIRNHVPMPTGIHMRLVCSLSPEQKAALAQASREARPNPGARRQFAKFRAAWRKQRALKSARTCRS